MCKLFDLLDKNVFNSEQYVSKLNFMFKIDSSPIWDFSENQILLDIEKILSLGGKAN